MKNKIFSTIFFGLLILGISNHSNASLMSQDLITSGDSLITYDSDTNLMWLDVSVTADQSYNDIIGGYGGYISNGFRYATSEEVGTLLTNAGVTEGNIWGYWNFSNPYYISSYNLVSLLGITYVNGPGTALYGLTSDVPTGLPGTHYLSTIGYNNHADSYVLRNISIQDDTVKTPIVGSFLVKESVPSTVPEPSSLILIGTGLVGLFRSMKRKYKANISQ